MYRVIELNNGSNPDAEILRKDAATNFRHYPDVRERIATWNSRRFLRVVKHIYEMAFSLDAQRPTDDVLSGLTPDNSDDEGAKQRAAARKPLPTINRRSVATKRKAAEKLSQQQHLGELTTPVLDVAKVGKGDKERQNHV
ncbi:hypothetical protein LTR62_008409 [Meristemomyces frigidus]|uniref:Uncharacterized protein n=1 Tax=Meristemomyces frigidus TaxID=1508187 RepID=A0AAN7TAN0_9PEZI|nr:hypothetical protein LTR62_008409 [Meristemomyces frigidus]